MNKHTKGPWEVEGLVESNGVGAFRIVAPCNTYAIADVFQINSEIANAHLIAAAPELLEALKRCLQDDAGDLEPETVHLAMEAIAKAQGRAK